MIHQLIYSSRVYKERYFSWLTMHDLGEVKQLLQDFTQSRVLIDLGSQAWMTSKVFSLSVTFYSSPSATLFLGRHLSPFPAPDSPMHRAPHPDHFPWPRHNHHLSRQGVTIFKPISHWTFPDFIFLLSRPSCTGFCSSLLNKHRSCLLKIFYS